MWDNPQCLSTERIRFVFFAMTLLGDAELVKSCFVHAEDYPEMPNLEAIPQPQDLLYCRESLWSFTVASSIHGATKALDVDPHLIFQKRQIAIANFRCSACDGIHLDIKMNVMKWCLWTVGRITQPQWNVHIFSLCKYLIPSPPLIYY